MRNLEASVEKDAIPPERLPSTKAGKRLFHILQIPKMEGEPARARARLREAGLGDETRDRFLVRSDGEHHARAARAGRRPGHQAPVQGVLRADAAQRHFQRARRDAARLRRVVEFRDHRPVFGEWSVVWTRFRDSLQYTLVLSSGGGFFWVEPHAVAVRRRVRASVHAHEARPGDRRGALLARLDAQVGVRLYALHLRAREVRGEEWWR